MPDRLTRTPGPSRRGSIYVAILGTALLVSLIGLAALAATRVQRAAASATIDSAKARLYAQSAVQLGLQLMQSDGNWRSNRASGVWVNGRPIDDGTYTIEVTDPVDGSLSNRPTDSVVVKGTGVKGNARQMMQVTLAAAGPPMDALSMAIHCSDRLRVRSGANLTVSGAPASTNGTLRNEGTITGDVECTALTSLGIITGKFTMPAPLKSMPPASLLGTYANLGAATSPPAAVDRAVLTPGLNPWGATNAEGVYLINLTSDLAISNSRINGTLVINGSGYKVTFSGCVFLQPARADYPVIITNANLVLAFDSGNLSEATLGTNFNPAGAPYQSVADSDTSDLYPSEIQGLVHTRANVILDRTSMVRGAIIAEGAGSLDNIDATGTPQVVYDPRLAAVPPMGYTKAVTMSPVPGSWTQVVNP